jgi:hypothetical protein
MTKRRVQERVLLEDFYLPSQSNPCLTQPCSCLPAPTDLRDPLELTHVRHRSSRAPPALLIQNTAKADQAQGSQQVG